MSDESNDIINDLHTDILNGNNKEINVLHVDGGHKPIQINVKEEISLTDDLDEDVNQVEVDQLGSGLEMSTNILEDFSFEDEEQPNFINDKSVVKLEVNDEHDLINNEIDDSCLNFDPDKEFSELRPLAGKESDENTKCTICDEEFILTGRESYVARKARQETLQCTY